MTKIAAVFAALVAAVAGVFAWSASLFARGEQKQFDRQKKAAESVNRRLEKIDRESDAAAEKKTEAIREATKIAIKKKTKTGKDASRLFRRLKRWKK